MNTEPERIHIHGDGDESETIKIYDGGTEPESIPVGGADPADFFADEETLDPVDFFAGEEAADPVDFFAGEEAADPVDFFTGEEAADPVDFFTGEEAADPVDLFAGEEAADPADFFAGEEAADPADFFTDEGAADPEDIIIYKGMVQSGDTSELGGDFMPETAAPQISYEDEYDIIPGGAADATTVFSVNRQETGRDGKYAAKNTEKKNTKKKKKGKLSVGKKVAVSVLLVLYVTILAVTAVNVFYTRPKTTSTSGTYTVKYTDEFGVEHTEYIPYTIDYDENNYNFLVLGHDRAAMLTDVFMLVNLNARDGKITIMQIPRDTWISDHSGKTVITNKINAVFSTYYNHYYLSEREDSDTAYLHALSDVAGMLEDSLKIDIYASAIMDLDGFQHIVDSIGGVDIDIPSPMIYSDPEQGLYVNLPAGHNHLDGEKAEQFVRFRSGYLTADLGRQNAQKIFMVAFFDQLKSYFRKEGLDGVLDLYKDDIKPNLDMDIDFNVVKDRKVIAAFMKCDLSDISLLTMPGNLASSYYVMNRQAMLDVINSSFMIDGNIPMGAFDSEGLFNNPYNSSINDVYNRPADEIFDNGGVFNGDDVDKDSIIIN